MYLYLGGGTKARMCRTTWTDSKWRPVPRSVMMVFSDSKPDQYIPLWDQKMERKCYRILDCREMGVWVLKVTITCLERFVREDPNTANTDEVSLSLLQIGANSYHEVALRSLWSLVERRAGQLALKSISRLRKELRRVSNFNYPMIWHHYTDVMDHLTKFDAIVCWTEFKLWTFRHGSKSIQMSLISWQRPPNHICFWKTPKPYVF